MTQSIALVAPYFGNPPNYFQLWLNSCGANPTIQWYLLGDVAIESFSVPNNVITIRQEWMQMQDRILNHFPFASIGSPIKLCDFRPAYGQLFQDIVGDFDFWGHCDMDTIWGNLRTFFPDEVLDAHDKIFTGGHFSLYRNSPEVNSSYRLTSRRNPLSHVDAFSTPTLLAFDEWGPQRNGMNAVLPDNDFRLYSSEMPYADIRVPYRALRNNREGFGEPEARLMEVSLRHRAYLYDRGRLIQYGINPDGSLHEREEAYIHLQKRKMRLKLGGNEQSFIILPPNRISQPPAVVDGQYLRANTREFGLRPAYIARRARNAMRKLAGLLKHSGGGDRG